jgi:hypothetical protein
VSVIAETLPDDAPFFRDVPFFFEKLGRISNNVHAQYFIASDCLCGIHRRAEVEM